MDIRKFTKNPSEYEEEKPDKDTSSKLAYTIFTDQRKTKANDELLAKDNQSYEKDFIERNKKDWKEKITNYGKAIKLEEENAKQVDQKVKELQEELKYQTEAEKMETQSKISALESKIKESEENIKLFKTKQKNAQDKIKKLEKKEQEIHKK